MNMKMQNSFFGINFSLVSGTLQLGNVTRSFVRDYRLLFSLQVFVYWYVHFVLVIMGNEWYVVVSFEVLVFVGYFQW